MKLGVLDGGLFWWVGRGRLVARAQCACNRKESRVWDGKCRKAEGSNGGVRYLKDWYNCVGLFLGRQL